MNVVFTYVQCWLQETLGECRKLYPTELSPQGYTEQTSNPASDPGSPRTLRLTHPRHDPPSWVREPSSQHFKITQAVVNLSNVHIHRPSGPFQGKCHIYWNISVCLSHLACVKLSYYSYKATMFIKKTKQNICQ